MERTHQFLLFYVVVISCSTFFTHSLNSSTTTFSCLPQQASVLLQLKQEFTLKEPEMFYTERSLNPNLTMDPHFNWNPYLNLDPYLSLPPYISWHRKHPQMSDWKAGSDCCLWEGVKCNMATGHVVSLDLSGGWLHGPLSSNSSLFRLLHLQYLDLAYNDFASSPIPSALGKLSRLTHLNLSSSEFSGQIPSEISMLTNLMSLDLSYTYGRGLYVREGELGRLIKNMTNLRLLNLDQVDLSSSLVPPQSMANLSFLTHLSFRDCALYGEFPKNIFRMPNIQFVDLSLNVDLTGSLPEFNSSSNLKWLIISTTQFSGKLPDSIGNLKSLNVLNLSRSLFSGTVPSSFSNLSKLVDVDLSSNFFKGQFPSTLGNLPKLTSLRLDDNEFGGELPSSIKNLPQLQYLNLGKNNFGGQISTSLGNLTQLTYLNISQNSFHGKFPNPVSFPNRIEYIDFGYNNLTGSIPSYNLNLSFLSYLDLSNNLFTGVIPWSLFAMPSLTSLRLDHNQFTDLNISNSSLLDTLSLSGNKFNGHIPSSISKFKKLSELRLDSNNLSGNVDFGIFSELSNLRILNLSFNSRLSVANTSMDSTIIPQFHELYLSSCNLSVFPEFLKAQDELECLDLSSNRIGGPMPKWFFGIGTKSLRRLNLSHNFISGWEEAQLLFFSWKAIEILDLRSNKFQGPLVVPPMSIRVFLISNNNLVGGIDPLFCKLKNLQVLDASKNHLSGTIPQCSDKLGILILKLANNNFHGNIPRLCSGESQDLETLDLSYNQLYGKIPRSLIKCKKLSVLKLGHNKLNDTFPFWLQDLTQLQVLILCCNKLHGSIWHSRNFSQFVMLRTIDLSHNDFTGKIPSEYFRNWTSMIAKVSQKHDDLAVTIKVIWRVERPIAEYEKNSVNMTNKGQEMEFVDTLPLFISMDLSDNKFYGEIPSTLWDLKSLVMLNLSRNSFTGRIPPSLGNLKELQSLDLSNNMLYGKIPQELEILTFLSFLNLSHNRLEGAIPQGGQVTTFGTSSFEGNLGLCGLPLSTKCTPTPPSTPTNNDHDFQKSDSIFDFGWKVVAVGYGCGLLVGFMVGHVITSRRPNLISKMFRVRLQTRRLR
ncbi:receptor-like protein 6 [Ziziphus jujuba]|uniref:Receptor-like protein 6 n=1 Tax=Ziziphus jujuba TaxID=326968 RepID=A0A6P3ZMF6_ZIZJJ|nr:receptor-like protein 6 [Ziziphus jujuba]